MKIALSGKILPDQLGPDDRAVALDEAAIGLMRENALGVARHRERIGEPGQRGHENGQHDGWKQMLDHFGLSSSKADGADHEIDQLDADEGNDQSADAID